MYSTPFPGDPLIYSNDRMGGGGVWQRFIFHTQKISTLDFVYPKKSLLFLQPKKIPLLFFATQKNPAIFHRPKKSLLAKISDPKKSLGPPPHH